VKVSYSQAVSLPLFDSEIIVDLPKLRGLATVSLLAQEGMMRFFVAAAMFLAASSVNAVTVVADQRSVCDVGFSCISSDGSGGNFSALRFGYQGYGGEQESLAYDSLGNGTVAFSGTGAGVIWEDVNSEGQLQIFALTSTYDVTYAVTQETNFSIDATIYRYVDNFISARGAVSVFDGDGNNVDGITFLQNFDTEIDTDEAARAFFNSFETTLLAGYTVRVRIYTDSAEVNDFRVGGWDIQGTFTPAVVPLPAAVWLFGSALAGLGWMRRKQTA